MKKQFTALAFKRSTALLQVGALLLASLLPAILLSGTAHGAQLTSRYVDLSSVQSSGGDSSEGSGRDGADAAGQDVTYTVGFTTATLNDVEAVVIDFCSNSPITGLACTAPTGFDVNEGTLALANQTGTGGNDFSIDAATDANTLVLSRTALNIAASTAVEFDLGTTAAGDGITNPTLISGNPYGTFYARILVYDTLATAQAYASATPGAFIDDGGIAMAIANELTITARVQEVLQFCVGTTDAATTNDCNDISGTSIDLGVVDSTTPTISATDAALAMIRTNASNGASVYYKTELDAASSSGQLQIAGQTCSGTSQADACFNSAVGSGTTAAPVGQDITNAAEAFGMTLTGVDTSNGGQTTNLARDAAYDGDGSTSGGCTAADAGTNESCWAWASSGDFDRIATSSNVLDDEMLQIAFAAVAAPTTPTGLYTTTANFVATSTF